MATDIDERRPLTDLTEEERLFLDSVAAFADEQIRPHVAEMDEQGQFRQDLIDQFFELGLMGIAVIISLFSVLIIRGIKIALDASDLYSSYLALGISVLLGLQVVINMGVVMGLLPTKGLTLPLLSYGGSSLLVNMVGIGILMSISARK